MQSEKSAFKKPLGDDGESDPELVLTPVVEPPPAPPSRASRWSGITFIVSILLHGLLTTVMVFAPKFVPTHVAKKKKSEVELLDPAQLQKALEAANRQPIPPINGQIVEQDEKALNDEVPEDSKLLSRHNQKVVRESQAADRGKFKNTDGSSGAKSVEKKQAKAMPKNGVESDRDQAARAEQASREIMTDADGVQVKGSKPTLKDLTPSFRPQFPPENRETAEAKGGGLGPSATDDHLKDVATGMQTLLSTREFVYYSYYNRIKDKLRQYWEPKIKEKMEHVMRQGRTIASNTERVTKIIITLDKIGTLVKVQVVSASGVTDLDEAAVEAFRAAAPFPNPPKGIVDSDGTIKIRWDFILEANASSSLLNALRTAQIDD